MSARMPVRAQTWRGTHGSWLVIETTNSNDDAAIVSVYGEDGDGPSVALPPMTLRAIAADLVARADVMDGGAR